MPEACGRLGLFGTLPAGFVGLGSDLGRSVLDRLEAALSADVTALASDSGHVLGDSR
jgi:hypothetical protein